MQEFDPTTVLLQLGILLAGAFLLGRLTERVGLPATTGELAAGLLLGPSVLGGIAAATDRSWIFGAGQIAPLRGIALFCGVLLIGVAGATIDFRFVRGRVHTIWLVSLGALGLPLTCTLAVAHLADPRLRGSEAGVWSFAVFAALALSVSAVPVIVKIFADLGVLHRTLSKLALSVAVIDDATVWVGLSIIAAILHLRHSGELTALSGDLLFGAISAAALTLIAVVARRSVKIMDRPGPATETGARVSCLVAAAFITLGAVLTDSIGLDSTLGAFVCGTLVASGRLVPVKTLRPLRTVVLGLLAPLFLAVNGLSADLTALRDPRLALAALATLLIAVVTKSLGAYGGGRLAGLNHQAAMAVSSALNARGTVQVVVAAAGVRLGLITSAGFTILVLVALVTSAMAGPLIRRYLDRLPPTDDELRGDPLLD